VEKASSIEEKNKNTLQPRGNDIAVWLIEGGGIQVEGGGQKIVEI